MDGRLRVMSEDRLNMPWAGQVTGKMGGSGDRIDGQIRRQDRQAGQVTG